MLSAYWRLAQDGEYGFCATQVVARATYTLTQQALYGTGSACAARRAFANSRGAGVAAVPCNGGGAVADSSAGCA
ncbi:MAG TPA: hypothetical protein VMS16_03725 [Mycobacterium sp.]|nr:hypothetical protein [Mycobacterium sp.]